MGPAEYLRVLRARWWAIAGLVLIGASVAWITTPDSPSAAEEVARFRATTVLVKGPSATGDPADATNLALVSSLVGSSAVLDRSSAELGRPVSELASELTVSVNDKAGTLQITTIDTDPARAVAEADTIAAQLVTFIAERRQRQLEPLITSTNERIATFENRIKVLDSQIAPPGSQADLQRAERDSLVRQLSLSYDTLQKLTNQAAAASNELAVLSPAVAAPDTTSTGFAAPDSRGARAGIGAVVGLLAGLALVLAFERMNPKLRTTAQAERAFGLPIIAEIPRLSRRSRRRGGVTTFVEPHSVAAESYRGLRTALKYMPRATDDDGVVDRSAGGHVVLVTSAAPGEGKTTVVANLAAVFAEKDDDVVVVSGDARQPAIETMLLGRRAAGARLAAKARSGAVFTIIPGVKLVMSCNPETNPGDIVDYECEIVERSRARSQTVIIDTPPALIANDATELMHVADSVVLVARCGSTTVASARRTAEVVARLQVAVVGVVLIGTDTAAVASSGYYRSRPRRGAREASPRSAIPPGAVGHPAPDLIAPTPPTPPLPQPPAHVAETVPAEPAAPVDDGGIWRPKPMIDLSDADQQRQWRPPPEPPPVPASARPQRSTVGDGHPSRDTLAPSDSGLSRFEERRKAYHESHGRRERLPLFRTGDHGNGNGHSR